MLRIYLIVSLVVMFAVVHAEMDMDEEKYIEDLAMKEEIEEKAMEVGEQLEKGLKLGEDADGSVYMLKWVGEEMDAPELLKVDANGRAYKLDYEDDMEEEEYKKKRSLGDQFSLPNGGKWKFSEVFQDLADKYNDILKNQN